MKLFLFVIICVTSYVACSNDNYCKGFYFDNIYYEPEFLREGISNLRGLTISRNRNESIFFTYSTFNEHVKSKTAYLTLKDRQLHIINEVNNTNTNAADDFNNVVYIGAIDGLYKLYPNNTVEKTTVNDNVISISVYNQTHIYYVNSKNAVYILKNGVKESLRAFENVKVSAIAVDGDENIVFIYKNDRKVGTLAPGDATYILYDITAKSLTVGPAGKVYVCSTNGVFKYIVQRNLSTFPRVAELPNLDGLVFMANGDPVYGVAGILITTNKKTACSIK